MVGEIRGRREGFFFQVPSIFGFLDLEKLQATTRTTIKEHVERLVVPFSEEFTIELIHQVDSSKTLYFSRERDNPRTFLGSLQFLVDSEISDKFEQFEKLLGRILTIPIEISNAERSFQYIKRIKSATWANMRQERLRTLEVLAIVKKGRQLGCVEMKGAF